MDVKFRAMTERDYMGLGGCVRVASRRNAYDSLAECLDSKELFGSNAMFGSVRKSLERANKRAFIRLHAPVFNYVLSRSHAGLLSKLLGIRASTFEDIINCSVVFDTTSNSLVSIEDAEQEHVYLYGAQVAEHYIKTLDIAKEIETEFFERLSSEFKESLKNEIFILSEHAEIIRDTVENEITIALPAGYYLRLASADVYEALKRNHSEGTLRQFARDGIFANEDTRLSYLLNLKDKSPLYGMLNYYIAVVPAEMRPETMGRLHPLTNRYATVINANQDLGVMLSEHAHPKDIAARFRTLDQAVSRLQYKCRELGLNSIKLDDMSLVERMKGKHGQVRQFALGKRQDYSGRSVVIVNPYLPLDVIRVSRKMLPSLLEFHILPYLANNITVHNKESSMELEHSKAVYSKLKLVHLDDPDAQDEMLRIIEQEHLLEKIPMFLGRQPTLHKHGLQGFHVEATDAIGIEVNPLVCPAYNMDFDGDTAHIEVPLSKESIKEVDSLLLTTQNLYLPKTGECTIMPRQDMLYGLYILTRSSYRVSAVVKSFQSLSDVREAVMMHKVKAWETVTSGGYTAIAGELAFISCFPAGMVVPSNYTPSKGQLQVTEITNKTIARYVEKLLETDAGGKMLIPLGTRYASTETFTGAINHIVELGFKVARIYSPSMSLLSESPSYLEETDPEMLAFRVSMEQIDYFYSLGLETSSNYKLEFDKCLEKMQKSIEQTIYERLDEGNGYSLLAKSGARGSKSNLVQIFAYKGRVKKNSNESFDALLENSYASQLAPLESFIAAYGGRQGQIDKSLNTGKTGYASRQMWHAASGVNITNVDCGTREGITISKEFLVNFCTQEGSEQRKQEVGDYFSHAIVGRFEAGTNRFITKAMALKMSSDDSVKSITIRSPLTCKNPCCTKCYGTNWGNHRNVHVGFPADLIAAQSIGEPGTQLTMKEFQKGGVVTKGTLTSAFNRVINYITVTDMSKKPGYDPIAWATGYVIEEPTSSVEYKRLSISGSPRKIRVPSGLRVKEYVTRGTGFSYSHGDYCLHELMKYMGIEYAQLYLIFKLYSLYHSECNIAMVHFEVLVAAMTRHIIIRTDRSDLRVGQYHTTKELYNGNLDGTEYVSRLVSVKGLPTMSNEALDSINMENHVKGLSRACLLGLDDTMTKPLNRILMGKSIINGSNISGFVANGKERV